METQHTPGPWKIKGADIVGERYVCELFNWSVEPCAPQYSEINAAFEAEHNANARLIAAGPELLEALKQATRELERIDGGDDANPSLEVIDIARAAIAKAEGR